MEVESLALQRCVPVALGVKPAKDADDTPRDEDATARLVLMEHGSQEIRVCALVLAVVAFFFFIAAEIVPKEHNVVLTLVALGSLGFAWIGPLTLLAGSTRSPKFKWWQPFQGGTEFVWMQAFGWSLLTLVLTGAVVLLANTNRMGEDHGKWMEGQYLVLGLTGFVAQVLLNLSIGVFNEDDVRGDDESHNLLFPTESKQVPWNAKAIGSMAVSVSAAILFVVYDLYAHRLQSIAVIVAACAEFILSAVMIHVFYGCKEIPGYRMWMPFEGERLFLLLQYLGWQFFACTIVGTMMLAVATDFSANPVVYRGAPTAVGASGLISQIVLLISLQHFTTSQSPKSTRADTSLRLEVQSVPHRHPPEVYVSALLCASTIGVGVASYTCRLDAAESGDGWCPVYLLHEKIFWSVSILALAIASPIVHAGAVRALPDFGWWQPFIGSTKFVFLQTLGWLWYGFFVAMSMLLMLNSAKLAETIAPIALLLGCGASGAIMSSLPYFEPQITTTPATRRSPLVASVAATLTTTSPLSTSARAKNRQLALQQGEITISLMMTLSSTLCHLVADYFRHEHDEQTPYEVYLRNLSLCVGTALFALGCFVSHASGKRIFEGYRLWQPFEGSPQFVVRQAIGWTLFAVQLLFETLIISVPAQSLPRGVVSGIGLIGFIPHLAIVSSIRHFRSLGITARRTKSYPLTPTGSPRLHSPAKNKRWRDLLHRPDLFSFLVVDGFVTFGAIMLFVGAHVCHRNERFRHADEVLYGFGFLLSVGAILFSHIGLGPRVQSGYRYFQPFQGGLRFITYQGVAWTLASVAWVAASTALYWRHVYFQFRAIHLLTGFVFFIAQAIMLHSLPYFKPPQSETALSSPRMLRTCLVKLCQFTDEFFVGPLLGMAACLVFVLVDLSVVWLGPTLPLFPVTACAVIGLLTAIPISYKFARSTMGLQAKAFGGGVVFLVLGCALWSFTIVLGALFCARVWGLEATSKPVAEQATISSASPLPLSTNFMGTFTGTVGFFAQLVFFQASEPKRCLGSDAIVGPRIRGAAAAHAAARRAKEHLVSAIVWLYSSAGVATGLVSVYALSFKASRQLPPHQVMWMTLCSLAVIACACWIQHQILQSGPPSHTNDHHLIPNDSTNIANQFDWSNDGALVQLEANAFANVAAFLTAVELMRVSSCCRSFHRDHDEWFWRRQFVSRFNKARFRRSNLEAEVTLRGGPTFISPFAYKWITTFENRLLNVVCRLHVLALTEPDLAPQPRPVIRRDKWRAMCISKELQSACHLCEVCGDVDLLSEPCRDWERRQNCVLRVPSTWVRLCDCINPTTLGVRSAHRACLEQRGVGALPPCPQCQKAPRASVRYPQSFDELCRLTWADFRTGREDFAGGFFSFVPLAVTLVVMSARSFQFGCFSLYVWVCFAMTLCFVSNTPRISQSFERIGVDETSQSHVAYQRLIHALTYSSMAHVLWCLATAPLGVFDVFLGINFVLLVAFATALLLLYWRTSYRIATFDSSEISSSSTSETGGDARAVAPGLDDEDNTSATMEEDHMDHTCIACILELCSEPQPAVIVDP